MVFSQHHAYNLAMRTFNLFKGHRHGGLVELQLKGLRGNQSNPYSKHLHKNSDAHYC